MSTPADLMTPTRKLYAATEQVARAASGLLNAWEPAKGLPSYKSLAKAERELQHARVALERAGTALAFANKLRMQEEHAHESKER